MIALASDFLIFRLASGVNVPLSVEMLSTDLIDGAGRVFDPDFVTNAASAVFYYFRQELGRQTVTLGEFAQAFEKVMTGFKLETPASPKSQCAIHVEEADLRQLLNESGNDCELFFFSKLRDELRLHLKHEPRILRFKGLRHCVKRLNGVQRWTRQCQYLHDRIVDFLRGCLQAEPTTGEIAVVVE